MVALFKARNGEQYLKAAPKFLQRMGIAVLGREGLMLGGLLVMFLGGVRRGSRGSNFYVLSLKTQTESEQWRSKVSNRT